MFKYWTRVLISCSIVDIMYWKSIQLWFCQCTCWTPQGKLWKCSEIPIVLCTVNILFTISFYIITQIILALWLVIAHDLQTDARLTSSFQSFSLCVLKWRNVLRIKIIFYVTGQKIGYKKVLSRHWTGTKSKEKKDKTLSFLEITQKKILELSQSAVERD